MHGCENVFGNHKPGFIRSLKSLGESNSNQSSYLIVIDIYNKVLESFMALTFKISGKYFVIPEFVTRNSLVIVSAKITRISRSIGVC